MNEKLLIRVAGKGDITAIEQLARRIWPATYSNTLTPAQLSYMLDYFYTPASLENQMMNQGHSFIICHLEGVPVGFASWSVINQSNIYKLHKLYVDTAIQGKGIGKKLVDYIEEKLLEDKASTLRVNVNRYNKARNFYEKIGFVIIGEEDVPIGHGIYQTDYVMEKKFSSPS
jgi:diamine N-acetyltransferase